MTIFQILQVFHASLCPLGHGGYKKRQTEDTASFFLLLTIYGDKTLFRIWLIRQYRVLKGSRKK